MDFLEAKDAILVGLLSIGVIILGWIANSVSSLNIKIAVVLEKLAGHEKRIERLEEKI